MPYTRTRSPLRAIFRALALLTFLAIAVSGWCKIVYVSQNAPGTPHNGSSWSKAFPSVQNAINASSAGDEVWVAAGTYVEGITVYRGVSLYGGFAGTETERSQRDWKTNPTIVDGTGYYGAAVATLPNDGTILDGFDVLSRDFGTRIGISMSGNAMTIAHCTIRGNTDAILLNGTASIADCTMSWNSLAGTHIASGIGTIANCTICGNRSGVLADSYSQGSITNCIVAFNVSGITKTSAVLPLSLSHNDVYGNASADYKNVPDPGGLEGNISADPRLSNPYRNVRIQPDSPCIDAGDDSVVQPGDTDADGQRRILGSHVDIGSDESDGTSWTVPSHVWYVSPTGSDANDGATWSSAKKSIGASLAIAQPSDEVWASAGTYVETIDLPPGVAAFGGFAGTETARDQRDWSVNRTVLDGGGGTTTDVITSSAQNVILDGFAIRNGLPTLKVYRGRAMRVNDASIILANCSLDGFNIGITASGGAITIANCSFAGDYYCLSIGSTHGTMSHCQFSGSVGGIMLYGGDMTMAHCTIGGASQLASVYVTQGSVNADDCIFAGGVAGIHSNSGGIAALTNCTVVGAKTGVVATGGSATVTGCTLSGNNVALDGVAGILNCTICGNVTGVSVKGTSANITNCTISGNATTGILVGSGEAIITNCIVASNQAGIQLSTGALAVRISHSDVFGNAADFANITDPTGRDGNISRDPKLSNPYRDVHIQPGSACIDMGDDSVVHAGSTDVYGKPRIIGAHVDIGSDESDGKTTAIASHIWYVSPWGADGSDGMSWSTAKASITGALSVAEAPDEVWVARGTYAETVSIPSGVSVYGGFEGSETARSQRDYQDNPSIISGTGSSSSGLVSMGFLDAVLDGFTIRSGSTGVYVSAGTATVSNCSLDRNPSYGVYVAGGSATVSRCAIGGNNSGIGTHGGAATVADCIFAGNTGNAIDAFAGELSAYGCTISGSATGIAVNQSNAVLRDCILLSNGYGIYAKPYKLIAISCTMIGNTTAAVYVASDYGTLSFANCVVAFNKTGIARPFLRPTTLSHNDVFGNTTANYWGVANPTGTNGNISADPLFVNRANADYHLRLRSPCIDAGDDGAVNPGETDLDGKPRIQRTHADIGCYEFPAQVKYPPTAATTVLREAAGIEIATPGVASSPVDLTDAVRAARKVAGLDPNP